MTPAAILKGTLSAFENCHLLSAIPLVWVREAQGSRTCALRTQVKTVSGPDIGRQARGLWAWFVGVVCERGTNSAGFYIASSC